MEKFLAVFHARNMEFIRDRGTFVWNLIFPIILVFGFAFTGYIWECLRRRDRFRLLFFSFQPGGKIILTPKTEGLASMIRRIELTLSDRPGLMRAVRIIENAENVTVLTFENAALNPDLNEALFTAL